MLSGMPPGSVAGVPAAQQQPVAARRRLLRSSAAQLGTDARLGCAAAAATQQQQEHEGQYGSRERTDALPFLGKYRDRFMLCDNPNVTDPHAPAVRLCFSLSFSLSFLSLTCHFLDSCSAKHGVAPQLLLVGWNWGAQKQIDSYLRWCFENTEFGCALVLRATAFHTYTTQQKQLAPALLRFVE